MADIFNEHFREFIQAKKASGKFRDLDDIEQLTKEQSDFYTKNFILPEF